MYLRSPSPSCASGCRPVIICWATTVTRSSSAWAQVDYKFNSYLGFRVGDNVKTPTGLLNETQDIDPAHLWSLLPQSVYPIASRDSLLDHYGAIVYGAVQLGERNKIEYRAYGGTRVIAGTDSVFQPLRDESLSVPNGVRGPIYGATLKWHTPLPGLMLGATEDVEHPSGEIAAGPMVGTLQTARIVAPYLFGQYEGGKFMLGAEYNRTPVRSAIQFTGLPAIPSPTDYRTFYVMSSYKISSKLTAGAYYSSFINRSAPASSGRFQKDWTVSARYDFNSFLYAKAEQHFMDGTALGFNASDNPNLQPTTRMTILKLGVSFLMKSRPQCYLFAVPLRTPRSRGTGAAFAGTAGARAQVVVIANNNVTASEISRGELRDVFTGAASSVKGAREVAPVLLKGGPAHDEFLSTYVGKSDAAFRAGWRSLLFSGQSTMPRTFDSDAEVVDYVAHTPGAVGYIAHSSPHPGVKTLAVR